jgi:hypothetical protein
MRGSVAAMHRLATLVALCAFGAAVLAIPASAASEKSQVTKYAKRKVSKDANRQFGIKIPVSDFTANCSQKTGYWKCSVNGNGGQCTGTLRVVGSNGKYSAPKKYYKVGCVADKAIAAGQQSGDAEKTFVTDYAKRVFRRKVEKGGALKLTKSSIKGSCKRNPSNAYWKCKVSASYSEGLCSGSMRVFDAAGKAHARNLKFGCSR